MATRRRRTTKAPEAAPTHEEMLEVAAEREGEIQFEETPEEEEKAIEVLMSMALADTFEALQKEEEEKGVSDFFDPSFYVKPVPIQTVGTPPTPLLKKSEPRYLERKTRETKRRTR